MTPYDLLKLIDIIAWPAAFTIVVLVIFFVIIIAAVMDSRDVK